LTRSGRSPWIGAYTLSTLANRLTAAPVDEKLRAFA